MYSWVALCEAWFGSTWWDGLKKWHTEYATSKACPAGSDGAGPRIVLLGGHQRPQTSLSVFHKGLLRVSLTQNR